MNLTHLLEARRASGKPVRAGLIGAGKFGSMFLSQVPTIPGLEVAVIADLDPGAGPDRLPERRLGRGADRPHPLRHRRQGGLRSGRGRRRGRGDRQPRRRHRPCARRDRCRDTDRHGQCRSRRARRSAPRPEGPRQGRRLLDGLWRPAGADRRAGRLGAGERLRGGRGRQGHQVPARLPYGDAGRRVAALRADARGGEEGGHEPADVQLVPRRHQVGAGNGGGG